MSNKIMKPLSVAVGVAFVGSLAISQAATASSFSLSDMDQGYQLAGDPAPATAPTEADKAKEEGKCGEGKCGADKAKAEGKCGADKAKAEGKCGEGHCGEAKGEHEGKCGEGKCGADKAKEEGKCGEGKCGDDKAKAEGKCGEGKEKKEGSCGGSR